MTPPNREERKHPEKEGWLVWDSSQGPHRHGQVKLPKKLRAKLKKAIRNIQTVNA